MNKDISTTSKKESKKTWSMSSTINGITTNVKVRELDNSGFLICLNRYGKKNEKEGYFDEDKEYYSTTNPLSAKLEDKEDSKEVNSPDINGIFDKMIDLLSD